MASQGQPRSVAGQRLSRASGVVLVAVALVTLVLSGCGLLGRSPRPTGVPTAGAVQQGDPAATALPRTAPFPFTEAGILETIARWVAAYNARDADTFLAHLADDEVAPFDSYGDCDYRTRRYQQLEDRAAVRDWLRTRWVVGDHFQLRHVQQGAEYPLAVGVEVHRTNQQLSNGRDLEFKLVLVEVASGRVLIRGAAIDSLDPCAQGQF